QEAYDLADSLIEGLEEAGKDVLFDDRPKVSPGVKFGDAEILGVPQIVVSGRAAVNGEVELWDRRSGERETLPLAEAIARLTA
ncbi:His/Gly/Thr/Pro-type tRNA ligase C-terminal domain-containing protein, partial [Microbacterium gubbeenense]